MKRKEVYICEILSSELIKQGYGGGGLELVIVDEAVHYNAIKGRQSDSVSNPKLRWSKARLSGVRHEGFKVRLLLIIVKFMLHAFRVCYTRLTFMRSWYTEAK